MQSAAALRARDTFTFEASFTRVKATAPDDVEEYATAEGALYLAHDEGGAVLELAPLFPGQEESPLGEPVQLRWTAEALTVVLDEKEPSCTRRFEQGAPRAAARGEAWIEEDGQPHRISSASHLKPMRGTLDVSLPRRTVRVTYELADFGHEYDPKG